jgi:phosphoglycolate phosphatase-like HAD superfamily hydrolase
VTIAFDLDGTLITTGPKQSLLLCAVARRFGVEINAGEIWRRKREGMSNRSVLLDFGLDGALADAISNDWKSRIETPYWQSLDRLFDDAMPILSDIRATGQRCILISARSNRYLFRQQVFQMRLSPYFTQNYCVSPAHAAAEKAAVLRLSGARLFVGDSESDFEAAELAGIPFRAVSTGQRSEAFLTNAGVTSVSASLRDLFTDPSVWQ